MNFDQQIQDLTLDINEIKELIEKSQRTRVKQVLEVQQRKYETDLINLKEKQRLQQEQDNTTTVREKTVTASATAIPSTNRSYNKDITLYAWDQSDKFVKLYVSNLNGISNLPEDQIKCTFEPRGFTLQIQNLSNVNYTFKLQRLLHEIISDQSSFKVKKDSVVLMLHKKDSKNWDCVLQDEKKTYREKTTEIR